MRPRTNNDLCTPRDIIDLLERSMGRKIALDPCSNPWSTVNADHNILPEEGRCGLSEPWGPLAKGGLVFVNPPYGRGHMAAWARKIAEEARNGVEIVALVKGDFSTGWWDVLREEAVAICYLGGRVQFEGGAHSSGNFPSAMFYFGRHRYLFSIASVSLGDYRSLI